MFLDKYIDSCKYMCLNADPSWLERADDGVDRNSYCLALATCPAAAAADRPIRFSYPQLISQSRTTDQPIKLNHMSSCLMYLHTLVSSSGSYLAAFVLMIKYIIRSELCQGKFTVKPRCFF